MSKTSIATNGNPDLVRLATSLFRQAAATGRRSLEPFELESLLTALGLGFAPGASELTDLRISLNRTREFGMVLSAGLGGLDAELDEGNFRRDRASVYAAAELTDADNFLVDLGWIKK